MKPASDSQIYAAENSTGSASGGYAVTSNRITFFFNAFLALVFLALGLPLFCVLALLILLRNDGPILYSGARLGRNKKIFTMYKFRTLPVGMQKKLGPTLFSAKVKKLPFLSKFLRDTRLDELPQLINILRGDMDFIGPRPLRPEVYAQVCCEIPRYDRRFSVRPGLIGYSQLFTPHSSPKRIRAFIDNRSLEMKRSHGWDLYVIFLTMGAVLKKVLQMCGAFFYDHLILSRTLKVYIEKRFLDRVKVPGAFISTVSGSGDRVWRGNLVDMNETHVKVSSDHPLEVEACPVRMHVTIRRNGKRRRKIAKCTFYMFRNFSDRSEKKYIYVFKYVPKSDLNRYMVDQYFLRKSVIAFS